MRRLANFGAALSLLSLGSAGCGDNNEAGGVITFAKFDMLADFEGSLSLNMSDRWNGAFIPSADKSDMAVQIVEQKELPPALINPSLPESKAALHATDDGKHTMWGTAWLAVFQSNKSAVDFSEYTGITLWARSDGLPVPTIKVAIADWGSYSDTIDPNTKKAYCDMNDSTVGGRGCYDDYSLKIYPDGAWRRYDIPFSQLTTGGYGLLHAFDPKRLYALKFAMLPAVAYSVWIDDIALYRKQ